MKKIKYVGKKESKAETMYGTGLTWMHGETLLVEDAKAVKLLNHPDVWEDVTGETEIPDPVKTEEPTEEVAEQYEENNQTLVHLEGLTKEQLSEFAMREFNIEFKARDGKDKMIETLRLQVGRNNVR